MREQKQSISFAFLYLVWHLVICGVSDSVSENTIEREDKKKVREEEMAAPMAGGVREVAGVENDVQTVQLARFALDEHNKKSVRFVQIYLCFSAFSCLIHGPNLIPHLIWSFYWHDRPLMHWIINIFPQFCN